MQLDNHMNSLRDENWGFSLQALIKHLTHTRDTQGSNIAAWNGMIQLLVSISSRITERDLLNDIIESQVSFKRLRNDFLRWSWSP